MLTDMGQEIKDGDAEVRRCEDGDGNTVMVRITGEALTDYPAAPFIDIASLKYSLLRNINRNDPAPAVIHVTTDDVKTALRR